MKLYRIFLAIGGKASPTDNNNMWVRNLYEPLVESGHDVYLLNIDEYAQQNKLGYMSVEAKERLSNDLPNIFNKEDAIKPFDIFFSYFHTAQIIPAVLKEIKKKVFTINYSTNFHQFDMYKEVAKNVDLNIYISKVAKSGFDELGVKSYWMPLAANPTFYKPSLVKNNETVFIGSVYGQRAYLFWRLLQHKVNIQIYGSGWMEEKIISNTNIKNEEINRTLNKKFKTLVKSVLLNTAGYEIRKAASNINLQKNINEQRLEEQLRNHYRNLNEKILSLLRRDYSQNLHPSLNDYEYVRVLSETGIVVNIQESRFNHDYFNHQVLFGSNLRDYEATMCGSFLCTQYSEEIAELFEIGKEIICYHNEHDLSEKIHYYSKNTIQRNTIAAAGYKKSIHRHTWQNRFKDFFEFINLKGN